MRRRLLCGGIALSALTVTTWSHALAQTSGFSARILDVSEPVQRTSQAIQMLSGVQITGEVQQDVTNILTGGLDYGGNVNTGVFMQNQNYPNGTKVPGNGDDFIVDTWATVTIPNGTWQIAIGSDDGGMVRLNGVNMVNRIETNPNIAAQANNAGAIVGLTGNDYIWWENPRGTQWNGATFTVNAPTTTQFRSVFYERGGGDQLEVIIRNANAFEATFPPAPDVAFDEWALLADGALGWSVKTDLDPATVPREAIGGQNRIATSTRSVALANVTRGDPVVSSGALAQVFRGGNPGNIDALRTRFMNDSPTGEGVIQNIAWNQWAYPSVFNLSGNADNYSVLITGEMKIERNTITFKDGVDDFTYFRIDTDGDGDLNDELPLINDNAWTDITGVNNMGSPFGFAAFTGSLTGNGAWRKYEFVTAEGGGGDSGFLGWDANPGAPEFPFLQTEPMLGAHAIPSTHLRVSSSPITGGQASGSLVSGGINTVVFEVDVPLARWDQIGIRNPAPGVLTGILDVAGANIIVDLNSAPSNGFTIDLVNDSVSQIVGTPASITFTQGDQAMWDISQFTVNGTLRFGAVAPAIPGDYNATGQTEQGDLDLVLLNWGQPVAGLPATWVNERPTEGIVDQAELDRVLLNWGATAAALRGTASIPEPGTLALLLVATGLGFGLIRKR